MRRTWPRGTDNRDGDAGFASVLVLSLSTVLALVACVLVALGAVANSRHRAASAADLGALAAASRALQGTGVACALARRVVQEAGTAMTGCRIVGDLAEVEVELRPVGALGALGVARGRARAGPAGASRPELQGSR